MKVMVNPPRYGGCRFERPVETRKQNARVREANPPHCIHAMGDTGMRRNAMGKGFTVGVLQGVDAIPSAFCTLLMRTDSLSAITSHSRGVRRFRTMTATDRQVRRWQFSAERPKFEPEQTFILCKHEPSGYASDVEEVDDVQYVVLRNCRGPIAAALTHSLQFGDG
jgi:hypothetical protein